MVKVCETPKKKEWCRVSDDMTKSTLEILSNEEIIYSNKNNSIFTYFGVFNREEGRIKAIVNTSSGRISVYDERFSPTAFKLAKKYENIAKGSFLKNIDVRKNWTIEKDYE